MIVAILVFQVVQLALMVCLLRRRPEAVVATERVVEVVHSEQKWATDKILEHLGGRIDPEEWARVRLALGLPQ